MQNPLRLPRKTTSQPSKVVRTSGALYILNWKCASRHNSVQLFSTSARQKVVRACGVFNILTWKATTACNFSTSQLSKVVWDRQFLTLLTWRCASRHTGVHFFDISSSKSAPTLVCFVHDLEMCFVAPSQLPKVVRTWCLMSFFTWKFASRHNGVHFFDIATSRTAPKLRCFAHFDLEMCFALQRRVTFHFSSGQMAPHPAALARLLFDPLEPQIIGKTQ